MRPLHAATIPNFTVWYIRTHDYYCGWTVNLEVYMALIKLEKIHKTYGKGNAKTPVLRNINLTIKEGEFIALMGPSGSGKSTLMHIIGLLDKPSSGHYLFEDINTSYLKDKQLAQIRSAEIGFVFQSFNLLGRLNARKNVALPMIYRGFSRRLRKVRSQKLLGVVGLGNRAKYKPNQLSGGQMQRVAIARALANNPRILLADEPTGNLDSKTGATVMRILKKLNGRGTTVIVVTHDSTIADAASRILHIKDGRIARNQKRSKS